MIIIFMVIDYRSEVSFAGLVFFLEEKCILGMLMTLRISF